MVRAFALLLVGGIVVAFVIALTAGLAALSLLGRGGGSGGGTQRPGRPTRLDGARRRLSAVGHPISEFSSRVGAGAGRFGPARPGDVDLRARTRPGGGRGPRGDRVGGRHADPGDLGHPPARAGQPPRASERGRVRERHGGLRPHLRHRHRSGPQGPEGDLLDARLRAARSGTPRLHQRDAVMPVGRDRDLPRDLAARLHLRGLHDSAQPAADHDRSPAAAPLRGAGHGHDRPDDRQAGQHRRDHVRDQGHALRSAEGPDRRHPEPDQPSRHRRTTRRPGSRRRSSAFRFSPPTPTPRCRTAATSSPSPACSRSHWS